MSLKINFGATRQFVEASLVLAKESKGNTGENRIQALAIDAIRVILHSLEESTSRLENKLVAYSLRSIQGFSINNQSVNDINKSNISDSSSILSEIWTIIDNAHRLSELIGRIKGLSIHREYSLLMNDIEDVRHSFQHLNERVKEYFNDETSQDCVFGNIYWRYRENISSQVFTNYLITGFLFNQVSLPPQDNLFENPLKYKKSIGVYDLNIMYVRKDGKDASATHTRVVINIDDIVKGINLISKRIKDICIIKISGWHLHHVANASGLVQTGCFPPTTFQFINFSKDNNIIRFLLSYFK